MQMKRFINLFTYVLLDMKKLITLFSALLVAASLPAQITWKMFAANEFAGGSGTEEDPYLISTPNQLAKIAKDCDNGNDWLDTYFLLTDDIDLKGYSWEPIGGTTSETTFWGHIDGGGHSLANMQVYQPSGYFTAGFVSTLDAEGSIRRLTIASGSVTGSACAGAFAAICSGVIEDCTNHASVDATMSMGGYAGGIAGYLRQSLNGGDANQRITRCVNYGSVSASNNNGMVAGGIVASAYLNSTIEQCANLGAVNAGNATAGGIVGIVGSTGVKVTDCYNTADILTGQLLQAGGIVGMVGDAKGASVDVTISNCYNAGYIGTDEEYHPQQNNSIVGFVMAPAKATLNNCFHDIDVCDVVMVNESGSPTINNCRNLTTDEMTAEAFVEELNGYSGEGVWSSDVTDINYGYPVLAYQAQVQEYTFDYTVTGSELGEVTVTDESGASVESGATLAEGSVVTLSATYPDDVDLTVTINGEDEDIEGDVVVEDGTCTYTREITVDGDTDILIVFKESGSGLAQTAGDDITVTAVDGTIVVMAADGTDVTVWTAAGAQAYAGDAAALAGQTFDAGVYIVRAGGTTHKVIVK